MKMVLNRYKNLAFALGFGIVLLSNSPALSRELRNGSLAGELLMPEKEVFAVAVVIPGSGPTDRNGNSPMGIKTNMYKLLAEELALDGIATIRIDKRGMFGSASPEINPNDVSLGLYAEDIDSWLSVATETTGLPCAWLAGHSEGALVALKHGGGENVCGMLILSSPGRKLGMILREQLAHQLSDRELLARAMQITTQLEIGEHVPKENIPVQLTGLFDPSVQDFLIDLLQFDPVAEIEKLAASQLPVLILQGEADLQVSVEDAKRLHASAPGSELLLLPGVTHVLKFAVDDSVAANQKTYLDPYLPLAPMLGEGIRAFIKKYTE